MSAPAPVHGQRSRGSRGRRISVTVWLVLFLLVAGVTVWRLVDYTSRPADQRVPAEGGVVSITESGAYSVYADSGTQSGTWGSVSSVTGPSGEAVPIERPTFNETYTAGSRSGVRVGSFTADRPGPYTIVGNADGTAAGDQLVVGSRTIGALLTIVFGAVATGLLLIAGLIGGLVLFLVGRRRRAYPQPAWGGGPPPAGWVPPQQGWTPQQGGPAPGWTPPQPYGASPQYGAQPPYGGHPQYGPATQHGVPPQHDAPPLAGSGDDVAVVEPAKRDDPYPRG